jgi:hypothetical protein
MHGRKVSPANPRAMVACTGAATDPPPPWQTKTVNGSRWKWGPRHYSVKYGARMIWVAELSSWVICFLHLRLRLTAITFSCCCLQFLDPGWKPTEADKKKKIVDGPMTEQVAELVNCMLPGSKIPKLEKPGSLLDKQVRGKLKGLSVASYNGPTCKVLNQVRDVLLEVPFPSEKMTPGSEACKLKESAKACWDGLNNLLDAIAERFEYPDGCTDAERQRLWEERAVRVDKVGKEYVAALKLVHPKCTSYYAHVASAHCGDQFRRHGYWPDYAMDGLEAKHSVTKMLERQVSNSKLYQRLATVVSHYTMRDATLLAAQDDDELREIMEHKERQKVRRKTSRVATTSKRVRGRQEDLANAFKETSSTDQMKLDYQRRQQDRCDTEKAVRAEETSKRRLKKAEEIVSRKIKQKKIM